MRGICWQQFSILVGRTTGHPDVGRDLVFSLNPPLLVAFEIPSESTDLGEILASHSHHVVSEGVKDLVDGFVKAADYRERWLARDCPGDKCNCREID